ncbi:maleylpyruvate isomerase family mycothiol-dependent enzyme [Luedemannella flava]|uniref:Maleylpyruvate isomerase family mycothiol-dependent enzyme n=1 Tax=Luedemannella flava TaxID=349316 RepID=A0ABN2LJ79_9ACTN
MSLGFGRHCAEIVQRAELMRSHIAGADLSTAVPTCPGWTLNQLVRHLGGGLGWAEEIVRDRALQPPSDAHFRDLSRYVGEDPAVLGDWLVTTAGQLDQTLRAAGPSVRLWTPVTSGYAAFYARRFAHETLIHGADATLALGRSFAVDDDVARDAIDEWLDLVSPPEMREYQPRWREQLGPRRTVALHATDVRADWLVDLSGGEIVWRHGPALATVAVAAPVAELLLMIYKRRPTYGDGIEVTGDAGMLDFWLDRASFG